MNPGPSNELRMCLGGTEVFKLFFSSSPCSPIFGGSLLRSKEPELPPPLKFWVKDREAGKVIGRGGETVREVMEKRPGVEFLAVERACVCWHTISILSMVEIFKPTQENFETKNMNPHLATYNSSICFTNTRNLYRNSGLPRSGSDIKVQKADEMAPG